VWNKASEDSVGQKKYYDTHKESYKASDRINATLYSSASKEVIENLQPLVTAGDSIRIQQAVTKDKIRKESGNFEKSDRPVLSKINWAPGLQVADHNSMHYLVLVKKLLGPGYKSFNEARSVVISDYQNHLEQEWIKSLKKKYPINVNKKGKQKLFDQLIKKQA
jgi:peptidyl-prolyl cis-trans isomerase SurA